MDISIALVSGAGRGQPVAGGDAMGIYRVDLVGEANYQQAIARQRAGNRVRLVHEPDNPYDKRAIKAVCPAGTTLGYIGRDSWVQRAFHDDGTAISATIDAIIGGEPGKPTLGVILEVRTSGDAEQAPTPPAARSYVVAARRISPTPANDGGMKMVNYDGGLSTQDMILIEQRVTNSKKSTGVAYLLWLFLFPVSAHRFYLGRPGTAILQILLYFVAIGFIWLLIDAFLIPGMVQREVAKERDRQIAAFMRIQSTARARA